MSSFDPPADHPADPGSGFGPEYLGTERDPQETGEAPRRRRTALVAAAAVAVVAACGAGAYGVAQLMSGGTSPATAVPADAVGYVSLDLDPSASQKIEAIKIFRKFPSLRHELRIGSRDDLRRSLFEGVLGDSDCKGLTYDHDVAPWIGERLAVAAVPSKGKLTPLVVLQVNDETKARAGVRALEKCDAADLGPKTGIAFSGDYMLLTEKAADATRMANASQSSALADDPDYTAWLKRAGDSGIVTMFASKDAGTEILDEQKSLTGRAGRAEARQLQATFKDFKGAAGVIRFHDGAAELEVATSGLGGDVAAAKPATPGVGTLPSSTAVALSFAFDRTGLEHYLDTTKDALGDASLGALLGTGEKSGLHFPKDVETLLGGGFDVAFDGGADLHSLVSSPDPAKVPAGIRLKGDADKITAVIDRLKAAAGPDAGVLKVRSRDGVVAVGTDTAYLDSLLGDGGLGRTDAFTRAVPDAARASSLMFVGFDAGNGWAVRLGDLLSHHDPQVRADIAPLDALGMSSWQDKDGVQHGLVRLTTD
ncbi:MAG: hypothetical protein QOF53_2362 [Nocardioidaceae bacterium]|nr:hypothetical protein [Nocardioidaceae bacterium]